MRYRIRHRTSYRYASDRCSRASTRCGCSRSPCATQTLLDFDLADRAAGDRDLVPRLLRQRGARLRRRRTCTTSLVIEATSDVVTHAGADEPLAGPADGRAGRVAAAPRRSRGDEALADELAEFLGPSAYIVLADESAALARRSLAEDPEASALAFFRRAADDVRERLEYRLGTTTVRQLRRRGARRRQRRLPGLRARADLALPPRRACPRATSAATSAASARRRPRTPGSRRSSRPTAGSASTRRSARSARAQHVKVGVGRDYADVAVLRGTYQGGGQARARGAR